MSIYHNICLILFTQVVLLLSWQFVFPLYTSLDLVKISQHPCLMADLVGFQNNIFIFQNCSKSIWLINIILVWLLLLVFIILRHSFSFPNRRSHTNISNRVGYGVWCHFQTIFSYIVAECSCSNKYTWHHIQILILTFTCTFPFESIN